MITLQRLELYSLESGHINPHHFLPGFGTQTLGEEYCELLSVSGDNEGVECGAAQRAVLVVLRAVRSSLHESKASVTFPSRLSHLSFAAA
jgi:hypothetical protein